MERAETDQHRPALRALEVGCPTPSLVNWGLLMGSGCARGGRGGDWTSVMQFLTAKSRLLGSDWLLFLLLLFAAMYTANLIFQVHGQSTTSLRRNEEPIRHLAGCWSARHLLPLPQMSLWVLARTRLSRREPCRGFKDWRQCTGACSHKPKPCLLAVAQHGGVRQKLGTATAPTSCPGP
jgi:hypothetical protein